MAISSFEEKLVGLRASLDNSKLMLEKQLKTKDEEIEHLKKELELKELTSQKTDIDAFVKELKKSLAKTKQENQTLELEILDMKKKNAITEAELKNNLENNKNVSDKLAKEQLRMENIVNNKEENFVNEIKNTLESKVKDWEEGGYSKDEVNKEKEIWFKKLQLIEKELEQDCKIIGFKLKKDAKGISLAKIIVIMLVLGGVIFSVITVKGFVYRDVAYSAPYSNPSAIIWDGKNLWSSDWLSMSIIKHNMDDSLSVNKKFQLSINPFGLTWDGENFWSCDSWAKKINKHKNDDLLTIISSYNTPGPNPVGVCWDGKNLWSADSNARKIYKHKMDAQLSIIDTYDTPGNSPSGIFWDGNNIWSIDSGLNRIYKHTMDDTLSVANIYIPKSFALGKGRLVGIASDGKNIWTVAEGVNKIYKHHLSSMVKLK